MKIYTYPNHIASQQVNVFLAEKGVTVKHIARDVGQGELSVLQQLVAPQQPVLTLDDCTNIMGAIAICRYFESATSAQRRLFGQTAKQQAVVEMWLRIIEAQDPASIYALSINVSMPAARLHACQQHLNVLFTALEKHLVGQPYLLGATMSVLDIVIYPVLKCAPLFNIDMTYDFPYLHALQTRLSLLPAFAEYTG